MSSRKRSLQSSDSSTTSDSVSNDGNSIAKPASLAPVESDSVTPITIQPAPLCYEPRACQERENCDYSIKITMDMAKTGIAPRKVRVYADGIYDLFHQGHARQLMQCKNVFPLCEVYLLVGCCNNKLTHKNKGKTVMDEAERYEALRHCRYVDEVVVDAPWSTSDEFLDTNKIDFVAHDELPYLTGSGGVDVYAHIKARGMFVATERTEGVSTSDIVSRIVRDYDSYVRRNLAKGYSRQELNVSFLRGQKCKLQNKVDEFKAEAKEKIHQWEEQSKELIGSFLTMFGGTAIEQIWLSSKERLTRAMSPLPSPSNSRENSPEPTAQEEEPPVKRRRRTK